MSLIYYLAIDFFVLPSIHEGIFVVLVKVKLQDFKFVCQIMLQGRSMLQEIFVTRYKSYKMEQKVN